MVSCYECVSFLSYVTKLSKFCLWYFKIAKVLFVRFCKYGSFFVTCHNCVSYFCEMTHNCVSFFVRTTICVSFLSETEIVEVFWVKLQLRKFSERPLNCYFFVRISTIYVRFLSETTTVEVFWEASQLRIFVLICSCVSF